jgi:hypothetical protein
LSDEILDQDFKPVISSGGLSSNLRYIESWKSKDVVDKMSTIYMSGLSYDLFDIDVDFVNGQMFQSESITGVSWEKLAKTSGGSLGFLSSPQQFEDWRSNLVNTMPTQQNSIDLLFNWYIN